MENLTKEEQVAWFMGLVQQAKDSGREVKLTAKIEEGEIVEATVSTIYLPGDRLPGSEMEVA